MLQDDDDNDDDDDDDDDDDNNEPFDSSGKPEQERSRLAKPFKRRSPPPKSTVPSPPKLESLEKCPKKLKTRNTLLAVNGVTIPLSRTTTTTTIVLPVEATSATTRGFGFHTVSGPTI
jgi:hypothetical protein